MQADPQLLVAAEMLTSHVSSGKSYTSDVAGLKELIPDTFRSAPSALYRALAVTRSEYDRLLEDGCLSLKTFPFSSWTSSCDVAIRHARGLLKATGELVILIIEQEISTSYVVADVEAVFRAVGWDHPDVEEWDLYVSKEKEFIVETTGELSRVQLEHCRYAFVDATDSALHPCEGDQVWSQEDGVFLTIEEVCAHLAQDGELSFEVVLSDETACRVTWDRTHLSWNLDERLQPAFGL